MERAGLRAPLTRARTNGPEPRRGSRSLTTSVEEVGTRATSAQFFEELALVLALGNQDLLVVEPVVRADVRE